MPAAGNGIDAPYDPEAHAANTRDTGGTGHHVQLTATRDDDSPHLMTPVETTAAPLSDRAAVSHIHEALINHHHRFPEKHLVETGSVDAETVVKSQQASGIDRFGPTRGDDQWQTREGPGFAASPLVVDGQRPNGQDEEPLDKRPGSTRPPGDQPHLRRAGWWSLPPSAGVDKRRRRPLRAGDPDGTPSDSLDTRREHLGGASVSRDQHFTEVPQASIGERAVAEAVEGPGVGKALARACEQ